jgi:hypothetical protein
MSKPVQWVDGLFWVPVLTPATGRGACLRPRVAGVPLLAGCIVPQSECQGQVAAQKPKSRQPERTGGPDAPPTGVSTPVLEASAR